MFDVSFALMLVAMVGGGGTISKALSMRPAVYVATVSYELYLRHLPVIAAASMGVSGPGRLVIQTAVPFALAAISYHFVSTPVRRRFQRPTDHPVRASSVNASRALVSE